MSIIIYILIIYYAQSLIDTIYSLIKYKLYVLFYTRKIFFIDSIIQLKHF